MWFKKSPPRNIQDATGRLLPPSYLRDLMTAVRNGTATPAQCTELADLKSRRDQYYYEDYDRNDAVINQTRDITSPAWLEALFAIFDDPGIYSNPPAPHDRDNFWRRIRTLQALSDYGKAVPADTRPLIFIIDHISQEANPFDQSLVVGTLQGLVKPATVDITPIIALTRHRSWDLRHQAIRSLDHVSGTSIESVMLDAIQAFPKDTYTTLYALATLREYATETALPIVEPYLRQGNSDVNVTALDAWAKVRGTHDTPLYITLLQEWKGSAKQSATHTISRYGDGRAIDPVIKRVKTVLRRRRTTESIGESEITWALDYLLKYQSDHPEISALIKWVRQRPDGYLLRCEQDWLDAHPRNVAEGN